MYEKKRRNKGNVYLLVKKNIMNNLFFIIYVPILFLVILFAVSNIWISIDQIKKERLNHIKTNISELIKNHTKNDIQIEENIFRKMINNNKNLFAYLVIYEGQKPITVIINPILNSKDFNFIRNKFIQTEYSDYLKIYLKRKNVVYDIKINNRNYVYHVGVFNQGVLSYRKLYLFRFVLMILAFVAISFGFTFEISKLVNDQYSTLFVKLENVISRSKLMFDNIDKGIVIYEAIENGDDFIIKEINKTVEVLEKVKKEDIIGKKVTDVFPGIRNFGLLKVLQEVFKSGKPKKLPASYYKDNEREGWRDNYVFKIDTGEVVAVYDDITKQKETEMKLREKELQLQQAQKMEAIGRLAGGVAHDFNNILTAINGYSEIILLSDDLPQEVEQYINEIRNAANKASNLTSQLLAFSRKQILKYEILNLNNIVDDTLKMIKRIIGEDIEVIFIADPELANIKADQAQLVQVLMNLSVNARDAMPNGGKLIIETKNVSLDEEYCKYHHKIEPGDYVMLSVTDTGIGMSNEVKEKIFEPFFTTKESGRGTGLGLSMVYGIVNQMNGFIFVYSEINRGTAFKIYFPFVRDSQESKNEKTVSRNFNIDTSDKKEQKIFIVEDEIDVREIICRALNNYGYKTISAKNGIDALEKYNELVLNKEEKIDLLITDIVMPGMNGKELYEKLRMISPELKVLYISGYTDNAITKNGILYDNVNFLQKPFNVKDLVMKVEELVNENHSVNLM